MADLFEATHKRSLNFLRAELQTGLTFATVALAAKHQDKIDRNRVNARKAYDSFVRYASRVVLSDREQRELNQPLAELRRRLTKLGERL